MPCKGDFSKSNGRLEQIARKCERNLCFQHVLMMMMMMIASAIHWWNQIRFWNWIYFIKKMVKLWLWIVLHFIFLEYCVISSWSWIYARAPSWGNLKNKMVYIYIYIYSSLLVLWAECSPMAQETGLQSEIVSYQRLKKWYLIPPYFTLSIIRHVSRIKWSSPGNGVAPFLTPWYCSYNKMEPSGCPWKQLPALVVYIYIYIYIYINIYMQFYFCWLRCSNFILHTKVSMSFNAVKFGKR